jgi:hypothetical protein
MASVKKDRCVMVQHLHFLKMMIDPVSWAVALVIFWSLKEPTKLIPVQPLMISCHGLL